MTEKKISCGDLPRLLLFYTYLTFLSDPWDMCLLCCALENESYNMSDTWGSQKERSNGVHWPVHTHNSLNISALPSV